MSMFEINSTCTYTERRARTIFNLFDYIREPSAGTIIDVSQAIFDQLFPVI